ncbi:hypothetical protein HORIV_37410 [Vreelandella olivaria]|uniref:Aminomethyltransferase n=1 Tax=Vreelandella olivaria TaxID=390919 RepID=A0ABM7GL46_9GAMM|nr:hypothetical protein HORIV_37410 [Halomonas olivaria]
MSELKQTPLHALHLKLGAKMVPFAGYDMPVQYPLGVKKSMSTPVKSVACLMSPIWGRLVFLETTWPKRWKP